jgi:methionyl-tRNA formyltransferase
MNIVFMGTPEFALPSLDILAKSGYSIRAIVTAPDKERGRGQRVSFTPVKQYAVDHSYPLLQPESLRDVPFADALREVNADLYVIVAFRILPPEVYTLPQRGAFNLHASLLPKYRGAAPINWAIINGEHETGVTTFFLRQQVDTGGIILQSRVSIEPDMTAGELHDRLAIVGAETVLQTVKMIESGAVKTSLQNDNEASAAPKIFRENCRIEWKRPAAVVHNFIRGLSPLPAAWTIHREKVIKIYRSRLEHDFSLPADSSPGLLFKNGHRLFVRAEDELIEILEIQQEGRRKMSAEEFLRGYQVSRGDAFD